MMPARRGEKPCPPLFFVGTAHGVLHTTYAHMHQSTRPPLVYPPQLCSNPFAPRVSNSLGVSAFSGSARPTCESINAFWPLYVSAANQLALWGQPANYETGFEVCTPARLWWWCAQLWLLGFVVCCAVCITAVHPHTTRVIILIALKAAPSTHTTDAASCPSVFAPQRNRQHWLQSDDVRSLQHGAHLPLWNRGRAHALAKLLNQRGG